MKNLKKVLLLLSMLLISLLSSFSVALAAANSNTELYVSCSLIPGESKTVPIYISNNDSKEHSYKMTTEGTANNYELSFISGGVAAKSVVVPSGTKSKVDLNIKLTGTAKTNEDKLIVKATSEDGKTSIINLLLLIKRDYLLSASSMMNKVEILGGKSADLTFSVTNDGFKELKSIKLVPELPYKWVAGKGSDAIISLKPGETGTFKTTIDVPSSQAAGNFTAKFKAISDETKSEQISIPVTVRTSLSIAYWMIGLLILIAGFTLLQLKRQGRR